MISQDLQSRHRDGERLPDIHQPGGLQQVNTSGNFRYGGAGQTNQPSQDSDVVNDQFDFGDPPPSAGISFSSKKAFQSPSRGHRNLNLKESSEIPKNSSTIEDQQNQQFERKFDTVKRYVENIVTGAFLLVRKDVQLVRSSSDTTRLEVNRLQVDIELLQQQHLWINRINALFSTTLGFLAGMSALHVILIGFIEDYSRFYELYSPYSMMFNLMFLILTNFCAIFGFTITLVFKQQSEDRQTRLDGERHRLRMHYTISTVTALLVLTALVALYSAPKYTNVIYYSARSSIQPHTIDSLKACYYFANGALCIAWILASMFTKGSISQLSLEAEDIEADEDPSQIDNDEETTTNE